MEVNQHALDESGIAGDKVRGRLAWDALWWAENAPRQERLRNAISVALRGRTPAMRRPSRPAARRSISRSR